MRAVLLVAVLLALTKLALAEARAPLPLALNYWRAIRVMTWH